jgi:hypothetical protein
VIEIDLAILKAIALSQSFELYSRLVEILHCFELLGIYWLIVEAAIELIELAFCATLIDVNNARVDYATDARRPLALETDLS